MSLHPDCPESTDSCIDCEWIPSYNCQECRQLQNLELCHQRLRLRKNRATLEEVDQALSLLSAPLTLLFYYVWTHPALLRLLQEYKENGATTNAHLVSVEFSPGTESTGSDGRGTVSPDTWVRTYQFRTLEENCTYEKKISSENPMNRHRITIYYFPDAPHSARTDDDFKPSEHRELWIGCGLIFFPWSLTMGLFMLVTMMDDKPVSLLVQFGVQFLLAAVANLCSRYLFKLERWEQVCSMHGTKPPLTPVFDEGTCDTSVFGQYTDRN